MPGLDVHMFSHVRTFPGSSSTKQRIKWLAQEHNTVPLVRLEPENYNLKLSSLPPNHCAAITFMRQKKSVYHQKKKSISSISLKDWSSMSMYFY